MGRPRLLVSAEAIAGIYVEQRASLRETSRRLGVSRWLVIDRLHAAGVIIRDHDEQIDITNWTKTYELESARAEVCVFEGCSTKGHPLCGLHRRARTRAARSGRCFWPRCAQDARGGACYYHARRAAGEIS